MREGFIGALKGMQASYASLFSLFFKVVVPDHVVFCLDAFLGGFHTGPLDDNRSSLAKQSDRDEVAFAFAQCRVDVPEGLYLCPVYLINNTLGKG